MVSGLKVKGGFQCKMSDHYTFWDARGRKYERYTLRRVYTIEREVQIVPLNGPILHKISYSTKTFKEVGIVDSNFGNSGLKISVISLGNMINSREENYQADQLLFKTALQNGINHIDTAQVYDQGKAETQLGKILKNLKVPREDVVIATKIRVAHNPDINSTLLLNRKHIRESIDKSLKRMQLDYVDILYAHHYDNQTPLQQICRGFHQVIEDGKSFYWATSNWDAQSVYNALAICERLNLHKPIGAQNEYSLSVRPQSEIEYLSLYEKYNYGLIAWSPLAGGFLTGKYLDGIKEQEVSRLNDKDSKYPVEIIKKIFYNPHATEKNIKNLRALSEFAQKQLGCKLIHLALAWVIKYQHLDSALIGARNVEQLEDTLKTLQILDKWTPEIQGKINKIFDNNPTPRHDFREWKPKNPTRPIAKQ